MVTRKTKSHSAESAHKKMHKKTKGAAPSHPTRKVKQLSEDKALGKKEYEGYPKLGRAQESKREPGRSIESRWEEGDDYDQERGF